MTMTRIIYNAALLLAFRAGAIITAQAQTPRPAPVTPPLAPPAILPPTSAPSAPQPTTSAQSPTASSTPQVPAASANAQTPAADPKDVATMDTIVEAV